jgi:uncharacterized membrane protein YdcZ (DUF606 family)
MAENGLAHFVRRADTRDGVRPAGQRYKKLQERWWAMFAGCVGDVAIAGLIVALRRVGGA